MRGKSWTNEICRLTARKYKQDLINNIKTLEKFNLIMRELNLERSYQHNILLREIGKKVAHLVKSGSDYSEKYFDLLYAIEEKILFLTEPSPDIFWEKKEIELTASDKNKSKLINFKMLELGWNKNDTKYYRKSVRNILEFKQVCDRNFFFIIQIWFSNIVMKYELEKESQEIYDKHSV